MVEKIALAQIEALDAHQAREGLNADTVTAYAQHVIEGGDLPPVIVFKDTAEGVFYLADGFHRVAAYKQAERVVIPADVRKGSKRDAFKHALGANEEHGLRRTNADRRRAVTLALQDPELGQLGDRALANVCKVSHPFVGKVRAVLGKADDSGLDDVDLWENETDPEKQLARFLACSDLVLVEALWAKGATFNTGLYSQAHNHRRALRGIAAAKLHADVAAFLEPERPGVNKAAVARSEALALYDGGATGQEAETLASAKEWGKALQFRNLSPYDRLVGLVSQRVKVGAWGFVENDRLLGLIPNDCAFVKAIRIKEAEVNRKRAEERQAQQTPWPWPNSDDKLHTLTDWINAAEAEELKQLVGWYRTYMSPAWFKIPEVCHTLRARLDGGGVSTVTCQKAECEHGFISEGQARCVVCDTGPSWAEDSNQAHIKAVRSLLRRGVITLAELVDGVVTLPPRAPVEAAPGEAAPVVEAAPLYRVGWGKGADVAKRLCGKLLNIARSPDPHLAIYGDQRGFVFPYLQELREVYAEWNDERIVPSPLVRWVPVFDMVGEFVNGPAGLDDLLDAINGVAPHTTSAAAPVTPLAVSDTDQDPIPFEDRDLWELAPLARAAFKKLLAYSEKLRIKDFSAAQEAAQIWQAAGEPIPEGMPVEVQAVLEALTNPTNTKEQVADLLHVAHCVGKVAIRWINNAEEDEPVKTTSPTGRAMKAIKDADLGAAAK